MGDDPLHNIINRFILAPRKQNATLSPQTEYEKAWKYQYFLVLDNA
jgi:hypothetical protein